MGAVLWHKVDDEPTQKALKQLDRRLNTAVEDIATLMAGGGGGITLPITMTDVTGLVAALAGKAATSHTHVKADVTDFAHTHAESDITGLVADLAAKVPTTRNINTTGPLAGGGALSADLTLTVADNSTASKGVVAIAPNDTAKFWRGDATWAIPALVFSGFGNGNDGAISFDGTTTPVAGATLSGSTYTMTRAIHATTINVSSGVTVLVKGFPVHATGAITGAGKFTANGGNATGSTGGTAAGVGTDNFYPGGNNGVNGVAGGGGTNGTALSTCIAAFTNTGGGGGAVNTNGTAGTGPGKGGGGGGGANGIGGSGGNVSFGSVRENDWETDPAWYTGRDLAGAAYTCGTPGGAGGGDTTPSTAGGGSGASGGWIVIRCRSITGVTIEAKGGNGATNTNDTGGGGGGSGGIVFVQYAEGTAPVPDVSGGLGANGSGTGGKGGDGAPGISRVWKVQA